MRQFILLSFILLVAAPAAFAETPDANDELSVSVSSLRSHRGNLVVALYNNSAAFPRDPSKAVAIQTIPAEGDVPVVVFKNLPPGDYAVALHHDEDADGKMSFNFLGMPKEGFGFSKNKPVFFGPPSFDNAKIELRDAHAECDVKVKYF